MKITKQKLKQIIKEEVSNALVEFDLDSELASIGAGVDSIDKKKTHRKTRDELLQTAIALQFMLELATAVRNKKSRFFKDNMPHGPELVHFEQIKKLSTILTNVAAQIKDSESLEENYQPKLEYPNKAMKELIGFVENLGTEMKQVGDGGMTSDEREVDNLILGKLRQEFSPVVDVHAALIFEQFENLDRDELVPQKLKDYLNNKIVTKILAPMKSKAKRGRGRY